MRPQDSYYKSVGSYYDAEAHEFEERYWKNEILQQLRQEFRKEVKKYKFKKMLEVGFGTGIDLAHFAEVRDEIEFYGLDVSEKMILIADEKLKNMKVHATLKFGVPESLSEIFPKEKFDMIYVFFGALNTISDLASVSEQFKKALNPNGILVLTFVNKWYVFGMIVNIVTLKFKNVIGRLKPQWDGYSPQKKIKSVCYSPADIRNIFSDFCLEKKRGFSILFPAWYMNNRVRKFKRVLKVLWWIDEKLNKTPAWKWGEYTLFVFKKR